MKPPKSFPLAVEELARREVWSVTPADIVVHDLSLSLPAAGADWQSIAFVTPDGVSRPAALSYDNGQLTGRVEADFTLLNSAVVTLVVGDTLPVVTRYRSLPITLTSAPNGIDVTTGQVTGPAAAYSTTMSVRFDGTTGTVSITADRPVWMQMVSAMADISYVPHDIPFPPPPPAIVPPPPGTVPTSPPVTPPVTPPATVPPVSPPPAGPPPVQGPTQATTPPVVPPPPTVPPPRPVDRGPLSPVVLTSAQLDHRAGAVVASLPTGGGTGDSRRGVAPTEPAGRTADRGVTWSSSYTLSTSPFAADPILRDPVRETPETPATDTRPARETRAAGRWILHSADVTGPTAKSIRWTEGVLAEPAADPAEMVLLRLAALPVPDALPAAEEPGGDKKQHAHLVSVLASLVLGGIGLRWLRPAGRRQPTYTYDSPAAVRLSKSS